MKKRKLILLLLLLVTIAGVGTKLWLQSRPPTYPSNINGRLLQEGRLIDAQFINLEMMWPVSAGNEWPFLKKIWVLRSVEDKDSFLASEGYIDSELAAMLAYTEEMYQSLNVIVIIFPYSPVSKESFRVETMEETELGLKIELMYTDIGASYDQYLAAYCAILEVPPTVLSAEQITVKLRWNKIV